MAATLTIGAVERSTANPAAFNVALLLEDGSPWEVLTVPEAVGKALRETVDAATRHAEGRRDPYGVCPHCGSRCVSRERRLNGNDVCAQGHVYPSAAAVDPA